MIIWFDEIGISFVRGGGVVPPACDARPLNITFSVEEGMDYRYYYDTDTSKWYIKNDQGSYEEYGVYYTSSATTYEGKLIIDENDHEWKWNGTLWVDLGVIQDTGHNPNENMTFEDSYVKAICVSNWGSNGEITYGQAGAVTDIGTAFRGNTNITKFDEFRFFTGVTHFTVQAFSGCTNLQSITIPSSLTDWCNTSSQPEGVFYACRWLSSLKFVNPTDPSTADYLDISYSSLVGNNSSNYWFQTRGSWLCLPNRPIKWYHDWGTYTDKATKLYLQYTNPTQINNFALDVNGSRYRTTLAPDAGIYVPTGLIDTYKNAFSGGGYTPSNYSWYEYDFDLDPDNVVGEPIGTTVYPEYYPEITTYPNWIDSEYNYSETYNTDDGKWYMKNNLGHYEEYGVYADSIDSGVTTYQGKLALYNGHEYEYSGNTWVDLGEVSGTTAPLPSDTFLFNINAKEYDNTTKTFANDEDATFTSAFTLDNAASSVGDDYVTLSNSKIVFDFSSSSQNPFNLNNSNSLTMVFKVNTPNSVTNDNIFCNRNGGNFNWMARIEGTKPTQKSYLHDGAYGAHINEEYINQYPEPYILAHVVSGTSVTSYYRKSDGTWDTYTGSGSFDNQSNKFSVFYESADNKCFEGNFYWAYIAPTALTLQDIDMVVDHNDEGGSVVYPKEYDEKSAPDTSMVTADVYCDLYENSAITAGNYIGRQALVLEDGNIYEIGDDNKWAEQYPIQFTITYSTSDGELLDNIPTSGWGTDVELLNNTKIGNTPTLIFSATPTAIPETAFKGQTSLVSVDLSSGVTAISHDAFNGCTGLKSIVIPSGVGAIDYNTFSGCTSLSSVTLNGAVTTIGTEAFNGCTSLSSIALPNTVTTINNKAFYNTGLVSVVVPDSVTSMGTEVFHQCSSLESVTLSSGVTSIPNNTFRYCTALTSVTFGGNETSIGAFAFQFCDSLPSLTFPDGLTTIGDASIEHCTSLTAVTMPDTVTTFGGGYNFSDTGLISVTIPSDVTALSNNMFSGCTNLSSITCYATTAPTLSNHTFTNVASTGTLYVLSGSDYSTWMSALPSGWSLSYITNPYPKLKYKTSDMLTISVPQIGWDANNTVTVVSNTYNSGEDCCIVEFSGEATKIAASAFTSASTLTEVVSFPETITQIDAHAFKGSGLVSVTIPDSVTNIGLYAFSDNHSLTAVTLPSGLTFIDSYCFNYCENITSISIPDGVYSIGARGFRKCAGLTSVDLSNTSISTLETRVFDSCTGLTSVKLPATLTNMSTGNNMFVGCSNLSSVTCYATTAPSIVASAFSGVSSTGTLYVPYNSDYSTWMAVLPVGWSLSYLPNPYPKLRYKTTDNQPIDGPSSGWGANVVSNTYDSSQGCCVLEFDGYPTTVPSYALSEAGYETARLTKIISMPDTITTLSNYAFQGQAYLAEIALPTGLTSIGAYGFYSPLALSSITLPSTLTSIGYGAFANGRNITAITCYATTAPTLDNAAGFDDQFHATGTLYVPSGSDYSSWLSVLTGWTVSYINVTPIEPLAFTNVGNDTADIYLDNRSGNTPNIQYSTNKETWTDWDYSSIDIPTGSTLYFRGVNQGFNKGTSATTTSASVFLSTKGSIKLSGNLESLIDYRTSKTSGGAYDRCFFILFNGNTHITDAWDLDLHLTTLNGTLYYRNMFAGCTSLVTAPKAFPARTLTYQCYCNAFMSCSNLENIPEVLGAANTGLANECYAGMFANCPKLTRTPQLQSSYVTVSKPYQDMFLNGSAITECTCYMSTTPSSAITKNWLNGVNANGILFRNTSPSWTTTGANAVPSAWIFRKYDEYHWYTVSNGAAITPNVTTDDWGAGYSSSQRIANNTCIINLVSTAATPTLYVPDNAFSGKTTLTGYETARVAGIGSKAFYGCTGLKWLRLGDNLSSIGNEAFANCNHSINAILFGASAPTIGTDVFTGSMAASGVIFVPDGADYSAIYEEIITNGCQGLSEPINWKISYYKK